MRHKKNIYLLENTSFIRVFKLNQILRSERKLHKDFWLRAVQI